MRLVRLWIEAWLALSSSLAGGCVDGVVDEAAADSSSDDGASALGADEGFAACLDAAWFPDPSLCAGPGPADARVACLEPRTIAGANVCTRLGCRDAGDCEPPPRLATARVECRAGVVDDDTACVLACTGFSSCPQGMVCSAAMCVWVPPR